MKKLSAVLTLFLLVSLLIAACGPTNNVQETPLFEETPFTGDPDLGIDPTPEGEVPVTGDELTPTPDMDLDLTPTPDMAMDLTPTPGLDETPISEATPDPMFPGAEQYALLSDLMGLEVVSNTGEVVGQVEGLLVNRPLGLTGRDMGSLDNDTDPDAVGAGAGQATATPMVGDDTGALDLTPTPGLGDDTDTTDLDLTPTPGVGDDTGAAPGDLGTGLQVYNNPRIHYVLVNVMGLGMDDTGMTTGPEGTGVTDLTPTPGVGDDNGVLDLTPTPGLGDDTGALDLTPTPMVGDTGTSPFQQGMDGNTVMIPWDAFAVADSAGALGQGPGAAQFGQLDNLMLSSAIDAEIIAAAPRFHQEAMLTDDRAMQPGWDTDIVQYWTQQGLPIPATGAELDQMGETVLMRDMFVGMNITDADGMTLGQVNDFVVDLTTGELIYAVLGGGTDTAGQSYAVPFSHLTWHDDQAMGATADYATGAFRANFATDALDQAPTFTNVNDLGQRDVNDVDTYWRGVDTMGTGTGNGTLP
jgi:sporulation protein YlmC with PRC-barrel domain